LFISYEICCKPDKSRLSLLIDYYASKNKKA
jgi:hypothetical protein